MSGDYIYVKTPFWFDDYTVLYDSNQVFEYIPTEGMTTAEKLNAVVRMSVYVALVLLMLKKPVNVLFIPLFTAIITIYLFKYSSLLQTLKLFQGPEENLEEFVDEECRRPSEDNPFMNNLVSDIHDPSVKDPCKATPSVKAVIKDFFNKNLFKDVGDLYEKTNSQRQFYTAPGNFFGTNHGDTKSFASWLFATDESCKQNPTQCTGPFTYYNEDLKHSSRGEFYNYDNSSADVITGDGMGVPSTGNSLTSAGGPLGGGVGAGLGGGGSLGGLGGGGGGSGGGGGH